MFILVLGNPVDGFKYEGLFTNTISATEYGELSYPDTEWWIAPIHIIPLIAKENNKYNNHIAKIADVLNELLVAINTNDIKAARTYSVGLAANATDLYNELCEGDSIPKGYNGHSGAGEDAPLPPINAICSCGHLWSEHTQNVHRTWVCSKCNCRNMNVPSEIPN
jgi:hypothetical protein